MDAEIAQAAYRRCLRVLAEVARSCRENGGKEGWAAVAVAHAEIRKLMIGATTQSPAAEAGDGRATGQGGKP